MQGKLIEIYFSATGRICGAKIQTCKCNCPMVFSDNAIYCNCPLVFSNNAIYCNCPLITVTDFYTSLCMYAQCLNNEQYFLKRWDFLLLSTLDSLLYFILLLLQSKSFET